MKSLLSILLAFGPVLTFQPAFGQAELPAQKATRIAPPSGGVEIDNITIERRVALGALPEADLTNMYIDLWFPAVWAKHTERFPHLIRFVSLDPIEDDTGRLLLTAGRRERIEFLEGECRGRTWKAFDGKQGPVAGFWLDAPVRRADTIKTIKGKVEVSLVKMTKLTFKDLNAINGKDLEHPDMKSLKDLQLHFEIEAKGDDVYARIAAPVDYASPRNRGRLDAWDMMDGEKVIPISSEGGRSVTKGVNVEKGYYRKDFKGWSLRLDVLEPVETKTFEFEFKAVPLP